MSKPLFAQGWYTPPRVQQLRAEIMNIYQELVGKASEPSSTDVGANDYWTPNEPGRYTWVSPATSGLKAQILVDGTWQSAGVTASSGMFSTDGEAYRISNSNGSSVTIYYTRS